MGFLLNLIPHLMMLILFGGNFNDSLPPWFCVLAGIAYFLYHLCDNMDGKQARRTKSSSPLGMILDHGIDAFTAVLNNIIMSRIVQ